MAEIVNIRSPFQLPTHHPTIHSSLHLQYYKNFKHSWPRTRSKLKSWVSYFGGQLLDTDPIFFWHYHFCGTVINIHTDINPYKRGTENQLIQRGGAIDSFYFKSYYSWRYIGNTKTIKIRILSNIFQRVYLLKISYFYECFEISGTSRY